MIQGELNQEQFRQLQAALASLELPPPKRRRLLWRMAKYGVEVASKRNVRNQQSPEGGSGRQGRRGVRARCCATCQNLSAFGRCRKLSPSGFTLLAVITATQRGNSLPASWDMSSKTG